MMLRAESRVPMAAWASKCQQKPGIAVFTELPPRGCRAHVRHLGVGLGGWCRATNQQRLRYYRKHSQLSKIITRTCLLNIILFLLYYLSNALKKGIKILYINRPVILNTIIFMYLQKNHLHTEDMSFFSLLSLDRSSLLFTKIGHVWSQMGQVFFLSDQYLSCLSLFLVQDMCMYCYHIRGVFLQNVRFNIDILFLKEQAQCD